ncbi:hypothetical protein FOTG_18886 [Fusarium oxysporum f. sp. vasinfectum 25433]|uniref:Uncharacterized protein n=1 Tax=Fusarium oxysporum f. sp. vasinfectum 25433 TaxID=1089449 RepID=X0KG92_FUSOX|nr:hypothetical protein FOTG_18886 [Fusarium oxysporum f. sp. vasinfectum 25433]
MIAKGRNTTRSLIALTSQCVRSSSSITSESMMSAANLLRWLIASNPPRKTRSRMLGLSLKSLRRALATPVSINGSAAGLLSLTTLSVTR